MTEQIPGGVISQYNKMKQVFKDAYVGYNAIEKRYSVYIYPLWMCKSLFITKVDNVPQETKNTLKANKNYKYKPMFTLPTI